MKINDDSLLVDLSYLLQIHRKPKQIECNKAEIYSKLYMVEEQKHKKQRAYVTFTTNTNKSQTHSVWNGFGIHINIDVNFVLFYFFKNFLTDIPPKDILLLTSLHPKHTLTTVLILPISSFWWLRLIEESREYLVKKCRLL